MDDKLGKVVRGLVKELEVALKTEKKSENLKPRWKEIIVKTINGFARTT